ncbi:MAG: hypothetical protein COB76_01535 [Alphaproteobacteria bacterium]|nr:MAG: hypothetical protein COB76_01535 [Alphaproteobacteria bacterium]
MNSIFFTLMLIAMGLTLIALTAGIILMGKGGEANIAYGNKLMRARVILQGVAIACFALVILTTS